MDAFDLMFEDDDFDLDEFDQIDNNNKQKTLQDN